MQGVRFYLDHDSNADKRAHRHNGNALAVFIDNKNNDGNMECLSAVYFHENSAVCGSAVSPRYLAERCRRVREVEARHVHPLLHEALINVERYGWGDGTVETALAYVIRFDSETTMGEIETTRERGDATHVVLYQRERFTHRYLGKLQEMPVPEREPAV